MDTGLETSADGWSARLDRAEQRLLGGALLGGSLRGEAASDETSLFLAGVKSLTVFQGELRTANDRLASLVELARRRTRTLALAREAESAAAQPPPARVELALEPAPCPLCGGEDLEDGGRGDRYGMDLRTARCRRCGFLHTNPRPTAAALDAFYRGPYRRLYRHPPAPTRAQVLAQGMEERARHTVDRIAAAGLLPAASVLELGCGDGSLLRELALRRGSARLHGVEVDPEYAAFAAAYSGRTVSLSLDAVDGRFDAAVAVHVLEHVLDPAGCLRRLRDRLTPGGRVYVDVPDAGRYSSLSDFHVAHVNHFTAETLAHAGRLAGLHLVAAAPHDPPFNPPSLYAVFSASCGAAEAASAVLRP